VEAAFPEKDMSAQYAADLDGVTRAAYFRAHPIGRPVSAARPLDPKLAAKMDRWLTVKKSREGLARVKEAARRIQEELEWRLDQARQAGGADPGYLLHEIKRLRFDLNRIEI
jgi:hypothetical protein